MRETLSTIQAATALGVTRRSVQTYLASGALRADHNGKAGQARRWRISPAELARFKRTRSR